MFTVGGCDVGIHAARIALGKFDQLGLASTDKKAAYQIAERRVMIEETSLVDEELHVYA